MDQKFFEYIRDNVRVVIDDYGETDYGRSYTVVKVTLYATDPATQVVTGTITVEVDNFGNFVGNPTDDGEVDPSVLVYSDPEGPYECVECHGTDVEAVSR